MPTGTPIKAGPTKAFFVKMLTRDIELADAILDLLDNCVDGIVRELKRQQRPTSNETPYQGFWAKITARPDGFDISDNCGGIPRDIAENSAFMLGRPDVHRDADLETVGMYGIGMKRAIFKMGRHCIVTSQTEQDERYKVEIPPEWLEDDAGTADDPNHNPWQLTLTALDTRSQDNGTQIVVKDLYDGINRQFDKDQSSFLTDLEKEIARHYALILEKGFTVFLNGTQIEAVPLAILSPDRVGTSGGPSIEPYVFVGDFEGVHVDLAVGFYRPLATEQQLDDETLVRSSRENAGWTVICNDRVVLYNDKSPKTGWGTGGVPGYHNQFISIAGVVSFRSPDSMKLPLNTTKRGIDTSSELYHIVLDYMREGLKKFTAFTNTWKRREDETREGFVSLKSVKPTEVSRQVAPEKFTPIRKHTDKGTGKYYSPELPRPQDRQRQKRICFAADQEEIEVVAEYYFGDRNTDRAEVGKKCFSELLERAIEGQS